MKTLTFIILSSILFLSCSKTEIQEKHEVWVRLENKTTEDLEELKIGEVQYGDLADDGITEYKLMTMEIRGPGCQFSKNGDTINIYYPFCGTPMPPVYESGYYTFTIHPITNGYHYIILSKQ
jgi:hypothetical protein